MKKPVILCVDDEKMVLDSLKTELKDSFGSHYSIETAENGEEALEILQEMIKGEIEIPVIISDYIMPKIKGDELLKEVHQLLPRTHKILLTGQATLEGVTNSINFANLYRYIAKPWEQKDLNLTVHEAVKSFLKDKQLEEQNQQLRELNYALELKVQERTAEIQKKNHLLELQRNELFQTNVNITASINYAKKIQQALLPTKSILGSAFPDSFIFYRPKDIVSGDFYWFSQVFPGNCEGSVAPENAQTIVAVADCTGHGVPGAFMSILGMSYLSEIIQSYKDTENQLNPATILEQLKCKLISALKQSGKENEAKDGMDIALCIVDGCRSTLQYAGAFNPLFLIRSGELLEYKADRMPIGIYINDDKPFTSNQVQLEKGDCIYLFSDGYVDQFGGDPLGKFKMKNFKQLLIDVSSQPMDQQRELLKSRFYDWKSNHEQLDDVTVLGFKI